jgi:hypothetical protein
MAPIISEKFRIFNAKQFIESLSEAAPSTMYFFIGRPQPWYTYLEVNNVQGTFDLGLQEVVTQSGGGWTANIVETLPVGATGSRITAILVRNFSPTSAIPTKGLTITGGTSAATAVVGETFRYATEDSPIQPYDSQEEKFEIYDDLIAAKRIKDTLVKPVIRKYQWATYQGASNGDFDMWRPDYSAARVGKTGASSLATARFFTINSRFQVFVCLFNSEDKTTSIPYSTVQPDTETNPTATAETTAQASFYETSTGLFFQYDSATIATRKLQYLWKYYYTIPTTSVQQFVSSDFIPIEALGARADGGTPTPVGTVTDGKLHAALVQYGGNAYTALGSTPIYVQVGGDNTSANPAIVKLWQSGGAITHAEIVARGAGYTYASVNLGSGFTYYTAATLSNGEGTVSGGASTFTFPAAPNNQPADIEIIIPVQGGHGADLQEELNGKRVMANITLTYAEGSGDFPVDNDFRRIGIIRDPLDFSGSTLTADNVSGLYAAYVTTTLAGRNFSVDEEISQTVTGGTARGRVVSWTRDGSSNSGWLKWFQSPAYHTDATGKVRPFAGGNNITGAGSQTAATATTSGGGSGTFLGMTFVNGYATPEIRNNSGEIIYVENRRLITRAADQIEDIKLVIEF